jgi:quercetin dioxygenase-like cupin family protein
MVFVVVQGEYEVAVSDGDTRRLQAGSVLLLEDTTGEGHSTRIISADTGIVFAVRLAAT